MNSLKEAPDGFTVVDLSSLLARYRITSQDIVSRNIKSLRITNSKKENSLGDRKACLLMGANSLVSVDLRELHDVKYIQSYFLLGCRSLQCVNLSGLSNVTLISDGFLSGCPELRSVNLGAFGSVNQIGNYSDVRFGLFVNKSDYAGFLKDCTKLQEL